MNTPLTTAEIVERLRKGIQQRQKHILDGDGNAIGLAGYTFDVDGTDTLMSEAASALLALEGERDAAIKDVFRMASAELTAVRSREAAEAELAKVRVALEPFGNIDGEGDEDFPDETPAVITFGRSKVYTVTLADFRRARAALSEKTV